MCLSINDTFESIKSKLTILAVCAVILIIVVVAIKYGTDSTEEDYDYSDNSVNSSIINGVEGA